MSWGTEDHKHNAYDMYGVAEEHHRHYDAESQAEGLREDLGRAEARIRDLESYIAEIESNLADAVSRIGVLEARDGDR